jgi:hypothetical protein
MTIYERLIKELTIHRRNTEELLLRGHFDDLHSYKYMVGKLKGVEEAHEIILDIFKGGYDE